MCIINSQVTKMQQGREKNTNCQNFDSVLCLLREIFSLSKSWINTPGVLLLLNGNASVTFFVTFRKSDIFENTISENIENTIYLLSTLWRLIIQLIQVPVAIPARQDILILSLNPLYLAVVSMNSNRNITHRTQYFQV